MEPTNVRKRKAPSRDGVGPRWTRGQMRSAGVILVAMAAKDMDRADAPDSMIAAVAARDRLLWAISENDSKSISSALKGLTTGEDVRGLGTRDRTGVC